MLDGQKARVSAALVRAPRIRRRFYGLAANPCRAPTARRTLLRAYGCRQAIYTSKIVSAETERFLHFVCMAMLCRTLESTHLCRYAHPMRDEEEKVLKQTSNPRNPWIAYEVDWDSEPPMQEVEVFLDNSSGILSKNDSPDIPFTYSLNPYRGCYHACAYCYARPTHQYLDFGAGTDFDRRLVVKPNAPELLRREFERPSWKGDVVVFSGVTDCYQPLERHWQLTRRCLEVCVDYRNPVGIITKGTLVERDIDLFSELTKNAHCTVAVSLPFLDKHSARCIEPNAPSPMRRLRIIETLTAAGIPVAINVAPIIPGLNDHEIPGILKAARNAGAQFAGRTLIRLPGPVATVFEERLRIAFPQRAKRIMARIDAVRGGDIQESRYGRRMTGTGDAWHVVETMFDRVASSLGYNSLPTAPGVSTFCRPTAQLRLFD